MLRALEIAKLKAREVRTSKALLLASCGVGLLLVTWLGLSLFGVLPDEYRIVNRRFVSPSIQSHLDASVGLLAVGIVDSHGDVFFKDFFTATAISCDGFMLTSRAAGEAGAQSGMWVFINGTRYEAYVVSLESLGDFALVKINGDLPLKSKISRIDKLEGVNQEVVAVGRQNLADKVQSPVDWPVAVTRGTISRVFDDKLGTQWIEHSAIIGAGGGNGGPLLLGDTIIGINIGTEAGISRAISIVPHRERIHREISKWSRTQTRREEHGTPA